MRELLEKGRKVTIVPSDYKDANKGIITEVEQNGFTVELENAPEGMLRHNYCEFYTQNQDGTLYFTSFPETIEGKTLKVANPSKHKYLQRRQFTRVKYSNNVELHAGDDIFSVRVIDISAGGMKFTCERAINLDCEYSLSLQLSSVINVVCKFSPIRIEKNNSGYTVSGRFIFEQGKDRMLLTQYCSKRSIEIRNK